MCYFREPLDNLRFKLYSAVTISGGSVQWWSADHLTSHHARLIINLRGQLSLSIIVTLLLREAMVHPWWPGSCTLSIDIMVLSVSIIGGIDDTLDIMSSAAVRGSYRQQLWSNKEQSTGCRVTRSLHHTALWDSNGMISFVFLIIKNDHFIHSNWQHQKLEKTIFHGFRGGIRKISWDYQVTKRRTIELIVLRLPL